MLFLFSLGAAEDDIPYCSNPMGHTWWDASGPSGEREFVENTSSRHVYSCFMLRVVEIAYEYTLEWGISSYKILGGQFDIYRFPQVDDSIADPIYGVTAEEYLSPPIYDVDPINDGAAYLVDVRGGSFTLTYNSELYYDIYGNILPEKTKSVTTRIAYYFNRTGTWDNP